jgi:hypothetical protein
MSGTTSILELPTESINPGNIASQQNMEFQHAQPTNVNTPLTLDQTTISQIVNGLQQASETGVTKLPSRDIPRDIESIVNDSQIQTNYIPGPNQGLGQGQINVGATKDYIDNNENMEDMIQNYNKKINKNDSLDEIYDEMQSPLLLAVLYFLFQLPFFKKILFKYFSVLFSKDGNYNINGYLFTSILFGLLFYFLTKVTAFFNTF